MVRGSARKVSHSWKGAEAAGLEPWAQRSGRKRYPQLNSADLASLLPSTDYLLSDSHMHMHTDTHVQVCMN